MEIRHPYENITGGTWLAGVLHLHDHDTIETAPLKHKSLMKYYDIGIRFLMFTEFDEYNTEDMLRQMLVQAFLDPNSVYRNMILVPGMELYRPGNGPHFAVGGIDDQNCIQEIQQMWGNAPAERQYQKISDKVNKHTGLMISVHPNSNVGIDAELLHGIVGRLGIEVLTGGNPRNSWMESTIAGETQDGQPPAFYSYGRKYWPKSPVHEKWDNALRAGKEMYCFAADDTQSMEDIGRFCNVVYVRSEPAKGATWTDVVRAIREGCFYVRSARPPSGEDSVPEPCIYDIGNEGNLIYIKTRNVKTCYAYFPDVKSMRHKKVDDQSPLKREQIYILDVRTLPNNPRYVRFECRTDDELANLWTQPFNLQ